MADDQDAARETLTDGAAEREDQPRTGDRGEAMEKRCMHGGSLRTKLRIARARVVWSVGNKNCGQPASHGGKTSSKAVHAWRSAFDAAAKKPSAKEAASPLVRRRVRIGTDVAGREREQASGACAARLALVVLPVVSVAATRMLRSPSPCFLSRPEAKDERRSTDTTRHRRGEEENDNRREEEGTIGAARERDEGDAGGEPADRE